MNDRTNVVQMTTSKTIEQTRVEIVDGYLAAKGVTLTSAERSEMHALALGLACKDRANELGLSSETIRARRKRIYRKLQVHTADEVTSSLLACALEKLARPA